MLELIFGLGIGFVIGAVLMDVLYIQPLQRKLKRLETIRRFERARNLRQQFGPVGGVRLW